MYFQNTARFTPKDSLASLWGVSPCKQRNKQSGYSTNDCSSAFLQTVQLSQEKKEGLDTDFPLGFDRAVLML